MRHVNFILAASGCALCSVPVLSQVGPKAAFDAAANGEYGKAVWLWRPLAMIGDPGSQFNLGLSYAKGRGTALDVSRAIYWYQIGAANGSADAQYNLAEHLRIGEGISQNQQQALIWFQTSAERKHQSAQNNLGMMYLDGNGTSKDLVRASMWFRIAIENGSKSARENLTLAEKSMDVDQIELGKTLASEWRLKHRNCSYRHQSIYARLLIDTLAEMPSC